MAMGLKPAGRTVLITACGLAVAFELSRSAIQVTLQVKTLGIMDTYMKKLVAAQSGGRNVQQAQEVMGAAMKIGMVIGFLIAGFWLLVKVLFYSISLYYLNRQRIRDLFQPIVNAAYAPSGP
jgi:Na+/H+-translocating membrane pyrophosphatase